MFFSTDRASLLDAVQNLSRIVTKTSLPVLEGILISAEQGKVTLVSYNLEMSMKKEIYASCKEEGDIVLSAKLLTEILRRSDGINVEIEADDKLMCHIKSGSAVFDIMGMSAEDFPETPSVPETNKILVQGGILKDLVRGTLFAVASTEGSRPILTGLKVDIKDGIIRFIGIDGRRMGLRQERINISEEYDFVISGKAIGEAIKIINDDKENIEIFVNKKLASFSINGYTLVSRLLEGEFMNFERVVKKEYTQELVIKTREVIDIIERISIVINDRFATPIKCQIDKNLINFSCSSSLGRATDVYEIELEGKEFEIGVNPQYLLDALRACETDMVRMKFNGGGAGFIIEPIESDSFMYMIMPIILK